MYKLQAKTKYGWEDVRDFRKPNRPIVYFNTEGDAIVWRMKNMGLGSREWTRIINTGNYNDKSGIVYKRTEYYDKTRNQTQLKVN
jgi:hypothetical protein